MYEKFSVRRGALLRMPASSEVESWYVADSLRGLLVDVARCLVDPADGSVGVSGGNGGRGERGGEVWRHELLDDWYCREGESGV